MFFKKRCHCNQHNDLIKLQELNKELKECKEKLNKIDDLPLLELPKNCSSLSIEYEKSYDRLGYCMHKAITDIIKHGKASSLVGLIKDSYRSENEDDFLKAIGQLLINFSDTSKKSRDLKNRIEEIKIEIEEIKKKLGIE